MAELDQYISADGTTYTLDDNVTIWMSAAAGQGMAPIEYITERGPFQHGEVVLDYRLRPRVVRITFQKQAGDTRQEYWDERANILDIFRPNRSLTTLQGVLRKQYPDDTQRDLNVVVSTGLSLDQNPSAVIGKWHIPTFVEFIAHDPLFYDPTLNTSTSSLVPGTELTFPITFDIEFDDSVIDDTQVIAYTGTFATYPTIVLTGPLDNPRITNTTINKEIELEYTIGLGEVVTINLDYNNKTVLNHLGANLIGTVTNASNLSTFRLETDPIAASGNNNIRFQGGGATANTEFSLQYYTRYIGI